MMIKIKEKQVKKNSTNEQEVEKNNKSNETKDINKDL